MDVMLKLGLRMKTEEKRYGCTGLWLNLSPKSEKAVKLLTT